MKVVFDSETDTLSLIFREDKIAESDEVREGIIIDYSKDGKLYLWKFLMPQNRYLNRRGYFTNLKVKKKLLLRISSLKDHPLGADFAGKNSFRTNPKTS